MKISELKLNEIVEFNGFDFIYKGLQKIRKKDIGTVEYYVFEPEKTSPNIEPKYLVKSIFQNKDFIKIVNGKFVKK